MTTWDEWAKWVNDKLGKLDKVDERANFHDKRIDLLFEKINGLENELLEDLFIQNSQAIITRYLRQHPHSKRSEIMKLAPSYSKHRLCSQAFYYAWERFEKAKVIVPESHGRGHERTWVLFLDKKEGQR